GNAATIPGAGAAGGLGAAFAALGGAPTSGAELILRLSGFASRLDGVDLCLTGEGCIDSSTATGKTPYAVLAACRGAGVPCVLLGGTVTAEAEALYEHHATAVLAVGRRPRPMGRAPGA